MRRRRLRAAGLAAVLFLSAAPRAAAQSAAPVSAAQLPAQLREVGVDQKLGASVPRDIELRDEAGRAVPLGAYLGARPTVLALVYYECPMLCTLVLNGLVKAARVVTLDAGRDYDIIAVSINPKEGPSLAAEKRDLYVRTYARPAAASGWHFLTGSEGAIRRLADSVGFRYRYDPATGEYAHASAIMVLTPEGRVARYLYGIEYAARDLRLALVEASANRIGSPVDALLLYCFHYDPKSGRYGFVIMSVVRLLGSATVLGLGGFVWVMLRRERRGRKETSG